MMIRAFSLNIQSGAIASKSISWLNAWRANLNRVRPKLVIRVPAMIGILGVIVLFTEFINYGLWPGRKPEEEK